MPRVLGLCQDVDAHICSRPTKMGSQFQPTYAASFQVSQHCVAKLLEASMQLPQHLQLLSRPFLLCRIRAGPTALTKADDTDGYQFVAYCTTSLLYHYYWQQLGVCLSTQHDLLPLL